MIRTLTITAAVLFGLAAPALACTPPAGTDTMRAAVLSGVNAARAEARLPPLAPDTRLQKAAQAHACDSAARDRMGHDSSDGGTMSDRIKRQGYRLRMAAENVGFGFRSGTSAVGWWMTSPPHRKNILTRGLSDVGIGVAQAPGSGKLHWVLVMGEPR